MYCSVNGSVCLVCCVIDSVCELFGETIRNKQFAMCVGVVAILLLNVMEVFSVGGGALMDRPCMSSNECACDPSVYLSAPSICFVYVFVCRKLSPHLRV